MSFLVSVIIPVYNRVSVVSRAIDSVLMQDADFELIVVDDGSDDGTAELLRSYAQRITLITQSNMGVSAARNRGIEIATGHYIAFLDSDDYWLKDKLKKQLAVLRDNPGVPVCHTEEIWIRNGVRVNQCKHHRKYGGQVYEKMLPLCGMSPSAIMMEKNIFTVCGFFDENLPACEDYELWLRITCRYPVAFISEPLIVKTGGHEDQLSAKFIGMDRFRITALVKALRELPLTSQQREATVAMLDKKCRIYAGGCLKYGRESEAEIILGIKEKYCGSRD